MYVMLLILLALCAFDITCEMAIPPSVSSNLEKWQYDMLDKLNKVRSAAGMPEVGINECVKFKAFFDSEIETNFLASKLGTAAELHAAYMARFSVMSHVGASGSTPKDRIQAAGFKDLKYGENIAYGQTSVDRVIDEWVKSPEHYKNMIGPFTCVGFAQKISKDGTLYWCQDFGTSEVDTCPSPSSPGIPPLPTPPLPTPSPPTPSPPAPSPPAPSPKTPPSFQVLPSTPTVSLSPPPPPTIIPGVNPTPSIPPQLSSSPGTVSARQPPGQNIQDFSLQFFDAEKLLQAQEPIKNFQNFDASKFVDDLKSVVGMVEPPKFQQYQPPTLLPQQPYQPSSQPPSEQPPTLLPEQPYQPSSQSPSEQSPTNVEAPNLNRQDEFDSSHTHC